MSEFKKIITLEENPHSAGLPSAAEWSQGWEAAADDAEAQRNSGREGFAAGKPLEGSGYKRGCDADDFWREGWIAAETDQSPAGPAVQTEAEALAEIEAEAEAFDAAADQPANE